MPMYALGVVPLIQQLADMNVSQIWYVDDASAGGDLRGLRCWWDKLSRLGPDYGYFPNPIKTCLIVKPSLLCRAKTLFHGTGIVISDSGKHHLGSAIGSEDFVASYVERKVASWVSEIEKLSAIAVTQPQAAFAAFTHVFLHCWSYIAWTTPWSSESFQHLDEVLSVCLLPAITGKPAFGPLERELLSLPARLGGLGIIVPSTHFPLPFLPPGKVLTPCCLVHHG